MGASIRVNRIDRGNLPATRRNLDALRLLSVDVIDDEGFVIDKPDEVELFVLNKDVRDRHLLLMARDEASGENQKFLCGHDERHWFAASVPTTSITVKDAKQRLMPGSVRRAFQLNARRDKEQYTRSNSAFKRQGEWFFVPMDGVPFRNPVILRKEPLVRAGGGKPHVIDEVVRDGGEAVYVHATYAKFGIPRASYMRRKEHVRKASGWSVMRRNPNVYARGKVRHPDHKTIVLNDWHLVQMNGETRTESLVYFD